LNSTATYRLQHQLPKTIPKNAANSGDAQLKPCRIMHLSNFPVADIQVVLKTGVAGTFGISGKKNLE